MTPIALAAGCVAALAIAGCRPGRAPEAADAETVATGADTVSGSRAPTSEGVAIGFSDAGATFERTITGFQGPESVKYDPELDAWFVSNITGYGSGRDSTGYIVRMSAAKPDSGAEVLVRGGENGAVLNGPKGLTIHGDTLWVADIDALRGFDRRTGAPLATRDFAPLGAVQLNDVAVAPDGTLRVTDTGILMSPAGVIHTGPDRIFTVGAGGAISEMARSPELRWPNGITWDRTRNRWVVVSFDAFVGQVATMAADGSDRRVLRSGTGHLDGVEVLGDGGILFTSWADSSVHLLRGGRDTRIVREVPEAADIGVDTRRNRLAIPLSTLGRVQLWNLAGVK